jgi:hypothetical protein
MRSFLFDFIHIVLAFDSSNKDSIYRSTMGLGSSCMARLPLYLLPVQRCCVAGTPTRRFCRAEQQLSPDEPLH